MKPAAATVPVRHRLTDRLLQPRPIQALQPSLTGLWIIIIGCAVVTAQDGLLGGDHQPGHRHLDNLSATRLLPAAVGWAVMVGCTSIVSRAVCTASGETFAAATVAKAWEKDPGT